METVWVHGLDPRRDAEATISASTSVRSIDPAVAGPRLATWPMVALLGAVVLGWSAEMLVQATLPLLILDRGGDAALVGFVAAAYAIPTLVLRPLIGRRIDRTGLGRIHQGGALLLTLAPLGYLLASVAILPLARLIQGLGWAMYGTANNVLLARLAPPSRRGEASGYFNVAWSLGFLLGPPVGLALYASAGAGVPFVVAALFAAGGLLVVSRLRRIVPSPGPPPTGPGTTVQAVSTADTPARIGRSALPSPETGLPPDEPLDAPGPRRLLGLERLVEPAAVPTMVILASFMAGQTLFLTFAPVYVREIGAPDSVLALYFPIYGALLGLGQLVTGRLSDRIGRQRTILLGSALGTAGLVLAILAGGWLGFMVGAAWYAVGAAVVNPALAAATIDRLRPDRIGVGMATFAIGYQLAAGLGGAAWGVLIAWIGFPSPLLVGIALQVLCVALALRFLAPAADRPQAGVASVRR